MPFVPLRLIFPLSLSRSLPRDHETLNLEGLHLRYHGTPPRCSVPSRPSGGPSMDGGQPARALSRAAGRGRVRVGGAFRTRGAAPSESHERGRVEPRLFRTSQFESHGSAHQSRLGRRRAQRAYGQQDERRPPQGRVERSQPQGRARSALPRPAQPRELHRADPQPRGRSGQAVSAHRALPARRAHVRSSSGGAAPRAAWRAAADPSALGMDT